MSAATSRLRLATGTFVLAATVVFSVVHVMATDVPPSVLRALEAQQALVQENPTADALNDLGNLLTLAGRDSEAETAYRRALERAPGLVAAQYNLGLLLQQRGDDGAAEAFRGVLAIEPNNAWAHYQLGVDLEIRGDRKAAIDHYARAFASDASLTFPANNPQLIESRLVTQAMIRAQRYAKVPGAQAPRRYGEANRIVELMMEPVAEEATTDDDSDEMIEDEEPVARTGGRTGTPPRFEEDDSTQAAPRVLSADDLEDSSVGQVGGGGGSVRGTGRRTPRDVIERYRRSSGSSVDRSGDAETRGRLPSNRVPGSEGGSQTQRSGRRSLNAPSSGFVPSRRSSANLDLELRPAAVAPAATR